jgi:hypothetical protein
MTIWGTTMSTSIDTLWEELTRLGKFPAHRRISADHPLDLYAEVSDGGRLGLLAISSTEPPIPPHYESVDVEIARRNDGRWAVRLILARPELKVLFSHLCEDIAEAGLTFRPESESGAFVLARLARWRRLLGLGPDGLLSENDVRGLVGELLFLRTAMTIFGPNSSVVGWNGPYDAPRDFDLPNASFEIKTIRHGAVTVRIGSLDQLDASPNTLSLIVYELSGVDATVRDAIVLPRLVAEIRSSLEPYGAAMEDFNTRLLVAGYEDRVEYEKTAFRITSTKFFSVTGDFPKLARSELPHAFAEASYELFLAACEPYRTESITG